MHKKYNLIGIIIFSLILTIDINFTNFNIASFLLSFLLISFITYFITNKFKETLSIKNKKIEKYEIITYLIIITIPLIISLIAYYPGFTQYDTINQWNQVQANSYNNWHPIFETLIFLKLPSLIYNNILSCTIFQILLIIITLMYFCIFLRHNYLDFKSTLIVILLFTLNPIFLKYSVTILKDIPYSYTIFIMTLFLINIVRSDSKWLNNIKNKIIFIIISLGIFLFRHNGVIPFFFTFLSLIIFYPKLRKFLSITLISILVGYYLILCNIVNMSNGGRSEMLGVIMGNLSYYYNNDVNFTKEELKVLDKLVPLDNYKKYYSPRNFNNIKWTSETFNNEADKNFNKIISMWASKSIKNPDKFLISYLSISSPIWEVRNELSDIDYKVINTNTEIAHKGRIKNISDDIYQGVVSYNNIVTNSPLRILFLNFGDGLFLILVSLYLIIKKTKLNLKRWLPFIPVILNTLVIMLLITGEEYRFVYSQILCSYPLLIYGLFETKDNTISKLSKFLKKLFIEKTDKTLIQFIRYIFVGGIAAVVNIGMLYVFTDIFKIHYLISNILAFILGLIVNYTLSKKLVFQDKKVNKKKEFIIYALIGVIGLLFDTLFMFIFTSSIKVYYMLSKIISTILVFIWNFIARKIFYKIMK